MNWECDAGLSKLTFLSVNRYTMFAEAVKLSTLLNGVLLFRAAGYWYVVQVHIFSKPRKPLKGLSQISEREGQPQ